MVVPEYNDVTGAVSGESTSRDERSSSAGVSSRRRLEETQTVSVEGRSEPPLVDGDDDVQTVTDAEDEDADDAFDARRGTKHRGSVSEQIRRKMGASTAALGEAAAHYAVEQAADVVRDEAAETALGTSTASGAALSEDSWSTDANYSVLHDLHSNDRPVLWGLMTSSTFSKIYTVYIYYGAPSVLVFFHLVFVLMLAAFLRKKQNMSSFVEIFCVHSRRGPHSRRDSRRGI